MDCKKQGKINRFTSLRRKEAACVDLFCGAGGLTHGLILSGLRVTAGVDIDEACRHPYESNNAGANFYARDVVKLKSDEVRSWFGSASTRILAGCAPCQPFSSYSNRYETRGNERWGLLNHFSRLVGDVRPNIVVMENVPTVTRHDIFDDFLVSLDRLGYYVSHQVVDISEYGLPQRRRRLIMLASLYGKIDICAPSASEPSTVRCALSGLPQIEHGQSNPDDHLHISASLSDLNLQRIRASVPGGTWRDWPEGLIASCHKRSTGSSYPSVYGRMEWDKPSPTVTTQFYGFGNGRFGHPEQDRALSLREGAILQGFPLDYSFVPDGCRVQLKTIGRLIGNAVPVGLGRVIGNSIIDHLNNSQTATMQQWGGA